MTTHPLIIQITAMRDGLVASDDREGFDLLTDICDALENSDKALIDMSTYINVLLESDMIKNELSFMCFSAMGVDCATASLTDYPEQYRPALQALSNITPHRMAVEKTLDKYFKDVPTDEDA